MRIRGFSELVRKGLEKYTLNDKTVVIDGQNLFYHLYDKSWRPFLFGSESDRYANYVRNYFMKFKKANVQCYFILSACTGVNTPNFRKTKNNFTDSIFLLDIYKQVLEDMGFEYHIYLENIHHECVDLAKKLGCPIISFDIKFCFSNVAYIPYMGDKSEDLIVYNEATSILECGIFNLNNFMERYKIQYRQLAIFIVIANEDMCFENLFKNYFRTLNIPLDDREKFLNGLLSYLSTNNEWSIRSSINQHVISKNINIANKSKYILRNIDNTRRALTQKQILFKRTNRYDIAFQNTPWFKEGILLKYIAFPYINLYLNKTISNPSFLEYNNLEDTFILILDIVKYAFDLLTNFNGHITFHQKSKTSSSFNDPLIKADSITKPIYECNTCVFENGWENIKSLNLFEHFISQSLPSFDFIELEAAPENAKLFIIALVYFTCKKIEVKKNVCHSIILCYVLLGIAFETEIESGPVKMVKKPPIVQKSLPDSTIDVSLVTKADWEIAKEIMKEYFIYTPSMTKQISVKDLQPLYEFQHCLQQLNYLNTLCGSPFNPTIYEKTYNGTFVCKILIFMNSHGGLPSIQNMLIPAPSLLAYYNGVIEIVENMLEDFKENSN